MSLQIAIDCLMTNDHNATWDECESIEELKEGLSEALTGYEPEEETYQFYKTIMEQI